MSEPTGLTTVEYLSTVEYNLPRELAHGILREPPAPFFTHQSIVLKIGRMLSEHVDGAGLGKVAVSPVDVVLDRDRALIVQPDVLFISTARLSIIRDQVWGAPDLVVEVLSPGTEAHDRGEKLGWYRQYGVRGNICPGAISRPGCRFRECRRCRPATRSSPSRVIPNPEREFWKASGARPEPLGRLLRALASMGVFRETKAGVFARTTLSDTLRTGMPQSMKSLALMTCKAYSWMPWAN